MSLPIPSINTRTECTLSLGPSALKRSAKMKSKIIIAAAITILVIPFFLKVAPRRHFPSFSYFLDELSFIEDALVHMEFDSYSLKEGDFSLLSVIHSKELTDRYLSYFEQDLETSQLTLDVYIDYAFYDFSGSPIRIWIDDRGYRVYSAGEDGLSKTGGLDQDDIWTGQPDKVQRYVHDRYEAAMNANTVNLWAHIFRSLVPAKAEQDDDANQISL